MGSTPSRLRFPSPALVLSCVALFAAVGGSTYAATAAGTSSIQFTVATLKNGWQPVSPGTYARPGYAKDSLGVVHLRGALAGGSGGTTAFVLPKALRPHHVLFMPVSTRNGTTGYADIQDNGHVILGGGEVGGFTSLDGTSFAAGE
jgi:hypothetical protein